MISLATAMYVLIFGMLFDSFAFVETTEGQDQNCSAPRVAAQRLRAHVGGLAVLLAARAQHRHSAAIDRGRKALRTTKATIDALSKQAKRAS